MTARIFSPSKTAMQSGKAKTGFWMLEFDREVPRRIDPLMGYTSSSDMMQQVRLRFPTKEEAIAYAVSKGITYRLEEKNESRRRTVSYSDNFSTDRNVPWTH